MVCLCPSHSDAFLLLLRAACLPLPVLVLRAVVAGCADAAGMAASVGMAGSVVAFTGNGSGSSWAVLAVDGVFIKGCDGSLTGLAS